MFDGCMAVGQGRVHAAEQRKERESLEELIHSIQLESELTSRAVKQTVSVSLPALLWSAHLPACVVVCLVTHLFISLTRA